MSRPSQSEGTKPLSWRGGGARSSYTQSYVLPQAPAPLSVQLLSLLPLMFLLISGLFFSPTWAFVIACPLLAFFFFLLHVFASVVFLWCRLGYIYNNSLFILSMHHICFLWDGARRDVSENYLSFLRRGPILPNLDSPIFLFGFCSDSFVLRIYVCLLSEFFSFSRMCFYLLYLAFVFFVSSCMLIFASLSSIFLAFYPLLAFLRFVFSCLSILASTFASFWLPFLSPLSPILSLSPRPPQQH